MVRFPAFSPALSAALLLATALTAGCATPAPVAPSAVTPAATTLATVLPDLAKNVIVPTYEALDAQALKLEAAVRALTSEPTAANLTAAREAWKGAREPWELSESHLLGPVKDQELDPALDSWPVNHVDLDKVLASSVTLDAAFIATQQPTLKGFHVIEYVLFANEAAALTPRKLAYLTALTADFKATTEALRKAWAPAGGNFQGRFASGAAFGTPENALAETLSALAEICEEVAGGKIDTPLAAKDPTLEESHFSAFSLADFRANMRGVQAMYLGRSGERQGLGLADLVAEKDPAADAKARAAIAQAIADLEAVPGTFATAITQHPDALRKAQASILALKTVLQQDVSRALTGKVSADAT